MNFTPTQMQQMNSFFEGKDVVVRFTMKNGNKVSNTAYCAYETYNRHHANVVEIEVIYS